MEWGALSHHHIKLLSHRKCPHIAKITMRRADNTSDKDKPLMPMCAHACRQVYLCDYKCVSWAAFCGFQPVVLVHRYRGGAGQWALYWWSSLFLLAWLCLSAEALLGECGCSLNVFSPTLADYRPNEIQIENFIVCLVCDTDTPLGSRRL